jgi:non-histone protein 10
MHRFCERERENIKERESGTEGFDMHKALAQAWRDLKQEGQKPYFDEYERQLSAYNRNKGEAREAAQNTGGQSKRATSATSSLPPGSTYDGAQSPAMGSANEDEAEDHKDNMGDLAFQAANK